MDGGICQCPFVKQNLKNIKQEGEVENLKLSITDPLTHSLTDRGCY